MWNRDIEPVLIADPGDTVSLGVRNAAGGQLSSSSTAQDVARLDFARVNPVTGPVYVRGAEAGDALVVDVLAVDVEDWGWTANIPGFGLLADRFPDPHLRISKVGQAWAEPFAGVRVPVVPFIGTIGVAVAEPGDHSVVPPSANGGNMDIRHVTAGSRLWLPVAVPGALLSAGDTHAAQGDGEVCGTAIEAGSKVTLRVGLVKQARLVTPFLETHPISARAGAALVTTGIGPDLMGAARQATERMIDTIMQRAGLTDVDAYLLASVAADLHISEIVDEPNWVVSMHIERSVLDGGV